jgi:hypothetical protein
MNWSNFFQLTVGKSVAAAICGVVVWFLVSMGAADVECLVANPPPPTFAGVPDIDLTPGPPTTAEGCQTYGAFLFMPADSAPFIYGLIAALAGWAGETWYKESRENKSKAS